ncbi:MAG: hypothetical protein ACLGIA_06725 [Actinomycetes bacterium]
MRRLLVALLAVLGLAALLVGIGLRTIWRPSDEVSATASLPQPGVVVTTAPGLLEARPGPVTVTARAKDGGPVVLAVGREGDVKSFVQGATGTTLTGFGADKPEQLTSAALQPGAHGAPAEGTPAPLPDPATSDLWVQREVGTGSARLVYEQPNGRWLLVAAGNGSSPAPDTVTLAWPRQASTPWSLPLLVAGVVLLIVAAVDAAVLARAGRGGRQGASGDGPSGQGPSSQGASSEGQS